MCIRDRAKAAALNGRNVLAAVNADFFNINDSDKIQPTGLMIQDGVELTPYYQFTGPDDPEHGVRLFFGVTDDGEAMIGDENTYEERKDELYQAVGGRYLLVDEGKAQTYDGDISFETERAPRTAVGIREDGSVLLVVIDGRNSGGSAGTTLVETADYMVELGAETALNLDGGGSSTAVIKNPETRNYEDVYKRQLSMKFQPCTSSMYPFPSSSMPLPGISPGLVQKEPVRSGWSRSTPVSMSATTTGAMAAVSGHVSFTWIPCPGCSAHCSG